MREADFKLNLIVIFVTAVHLAFQQLLNVAILQHKRLLFSGYFHSTLQFCSRNVLRGKLHSFYSYIYFTDLLLVKS